MSGGGPRVILPSVRLNDANVASYLADLGLLHGAEIVSAGDGNINYVRRLRDPAGHALVVKQARAALERFPEYEVTTERIVFEHRFGETLRSAAPDAAKLLPQVIHFDAAARILVLEDLGDVRLEEELLSGRVPLSALATLGRFLGEVALKTGPSAPRLAERFANDEMRALHGEHIFTLPFEANDFGIDPEVASEAERRLGPGVRRRIRALRESYYEAREALVHGDVQAANLLLQGDLPRLLDAEIAHVGDAAFDLGVALAQVQVHGVLHPDDERWLHAEQALVAGFSQGGGDPALCDRARAYSAVEMLRRTLGAARKSFLERVEAAVPVLKLATSALS